MSNNVTNFITNQNSQEQSTTLDFATLQNMLNSSASLMSDLIGGMTAAAEAASDIIKDGALDAARSEAYSLDS